MKSNIVVRLAEKVVSILKALNEANEDIIEILRLLESSTYSDGIVAFGKLNELLRNKYNQIEEISLIDLTLFQDISNNEDLYGFSGMIMHGYKNVKIDFGFF